MARLTRTELRQRWAELRELVNAWDPVGFIAIGAPPNEYEDVVGPLMRWLEADMGASAIAAQLEKLFREDYELTPRDVAAFAERAVYWYTLRWPASESVPRGDVV